MYTCTHGDVVAKHARNARYAHRARAQPASVNSLTRRAAIRSLHFPGRDVGLIAQGEVEVAARTDKQLLALPQRLSAVRLRGGEVAPPPSPPPPPRPSMRHLGGSGRVGSGAHGSLSALASRCKRWRRKARWTEERRRTGWKKDQTRGSAHCESHHEVIREFGF